MDRAPPTADGDAWTLYLARLRQERLDKQNTRLRQEIDANRAWLASQTLEPVPPPPTPTHRQHVRQWCEVQRRQAPKGKTRCRAARGASTLACTAYTAAVEGGVKGGDEMEDQITVTLFAAKPNALFDEALQRAVRFLRYSAAVACAECGRRSKHHWTLLVLFTAKVWPKNGFDLTGSGTHLAPLTPVCRAHLLAPVVEEDA